MIDNLSDFSAEGQTITYGFSAVNFTAAEGIVQVTVIKEGTNVADYHISVNLLTFPIFDQTLTAPAEITERPDPAESKS